MSRLFAVQWTREDGLSYEFIMKVPQHFVTDLDRSVACASRARLGVSGAATE
jgi:hypothetical protein